MSWAARRRFIILFIVGAVIVAFLAIVLIATLYKAPSCIDGMQNGDESGVDCGGSCPYRCTAQVQAPTVLFTKAVPNGDGRVDIAALIENKNPDVAAKNISYSISIYGTDQTLIQRLSGFFDLPPGATVPVFVPGVSSGKQKVGNAFLEIASTTPNWYTLPLDPRILPVVSNTALGGTPFAPRITATLSNRSVTQLTNVRAVVLVRNVSGEVVGASQTIVTSIPAQGQATATFTWNNPFASPATTIEVFPIVPLP